MLLQERAEDFYARLNGELKRFSTGDRFYSIREMGRKFGVSYRVVTAVLNRMETEGILERRDRSGLYIRSTRARRTVTYFYVDWPSKHAQLLADNFGKALKELDDYDFSALPFSYQSPLLPQLENCTADLIISDWPSAQIKENELKWLSTFSKPLIFCDRDLRDTRLHCFYSNNGYAALLALSCFRRNGHSRLGVLLAEPPSGGYRTIYRNFIDFARLFSDEVIPILCESESGNYSPERAHHALGQHLDQHGLNFTGLFIISGSSAQGALLALYEHGISVPDDLSIIAFGNPEETAFFTPPLTTIGGREAEAARDKAAAVHRYFNDPSSGSIAVEYKAALIERKSVKNITLTLQPKFKEEIV